MATEYGARLRAARKHAGLTQQELSKKAGIPQSTISTAERMGSGSAETITYAQVCGVDANWLAKGEGDMLARQLESGSVGGGLAVTNTEPGPSLTKALEIVVAALSNVPVGRRKAVADDLGLLAMAPDSSETLARLATSLAPVRQESRLPSAESHEFQPPVPPSIFLKNTEKT